MGAKRAGVDVAGCEGTQGIAEVGQGVPRRLGSRGGAKFCRLYTRRRVAEALPEIAEKFLAEAKKGSIPHAKVLLKLSGLEEKEKAVKPRRGKSLAGRLLEELKKTPAQ